MDTRNVSSSVSYRLGYNGKEKDNEVYGLGNSHDFGARIYNDRIAVFLSLDPLSRQFPSESNYSYAGNNPILFIDKEGKKKTIYHYTIDMRKGTITLPNKGSVVDGLYSQHRSFYNSLREYWSWFDYSINQVTVIDMEGKKQTYESSAFGINYSKERAWTAVPFEWMARAAVGEAPDWMATTKDNSKAWDGKTYTGFRFASKSKDLWIGRDNHLNADGDANSKTIYIDDLLAVLGVGNAAMGAKNPSNIQELLKHVNDVAQTANSAREMAPFKEEKRKERPKVTCPTCGSPDSDSAHVDNVGGEGTYQKQLKKENKR